MAQKDKPQKKAGANRAALLHALEGYSKPRVDTKNTEEIAERIDEYLRYCAENDLAPGAAMCANWLGISISTLQSWYAGIRGTPTHQRIAARFYGIIQSVWEEDMHEGNINPVSGIFIGKAFYGYKDTQEIVVQHTNSERLSVADLIAESKRLPGAENLSLTDNAQTIDADYKVIETPIEDDSRHQKAVDRQKRAEERLAASIADRPRQKAAKKEYLKNYFQEHKEEYNERHRGYRKRDAEQKKNSTS